MTMQTIGRTELVRFPILVPEDIDGIVAKIDTGADSGAIHCVHIEYGLDEDGKKYVEYKAVDEMHPLHRTYEFTRVRVTSSNGTIERRFRIPTDVEINGESHHIEITLSDRGDMNYDVIIGWKFLQNKFLVDSSITADQNIRDL